MKTTEASTRQPLWQSRFVDEHLIDLNATKAY